MKKFLIATSLAVMLSGCFGSVTLDTSSQETIQSSSKEIVKTLSEDQRQEFGKAIVYYTMGGPDGMKRIMRAKSNEERDEISAESMAEIDGLTGEEIIEKYHESIQ